LLATVYDYYLLRWSLETDPGQVIITGENPAVVSLMQYLKSEVEQALTDLQSPSSTSFAYEVTSKI